jgi:hypothetical protein
MPPPHYHTQWGGGACVPPFWAAQLAMRTGATFFKKKQVPPCARPWTAHAACQMIRSGFTAQMGLLD